MSPRHVAWQEDHQARAVALNVSGRYMTVAIELVLGLVMLPFNTRYLGASDYGLWMLAASIVAYFPVLDLGYGGAMDRFVAHYRARRDAAAINEIASTLIVIFSGLGLVAFGLASVIAWNLGAFFHLDANQATAGGIVLLLVAAQITVGLPFAVFGAVVNGFQRTYLNSIVGSAVAVAVAVVNVAVLLAGWGLVELVAAMTSTRLLGYAAYRLNAYLTFPLLRIRPSLFRRTRLKEVTRFSVYMLIQNLSQKVNYATDPIVIAAVLTTGFVAIWTVAQRLADVVLRLTNQLNESLFPVVVDCDATRRDDRLRDLLVQGTRLSLATTFPLAGALALLAEPVVLAWTGPEYRAAARIVEVLMMVQVVRVGTATAGTVLQGAGHHRLVAVSNLIASIVNIGLSILLIRSFGLAGVAFATLIPVAVRALAVLVPVSCRRVGMSLGHFAAAAVWPAAWPAVVVLGALAVFRDGAPGSLLRVGLYIAATAVAYAALFIGIAVGQDDRRRYVGKLRSFAGRPALEAA